MTAKVFVDTNVLIYNRDASEPEKQKMARAWMEHLWATRLGRLSFQVLQEYYVTITTKLVPGLNPQSARHDVRSLLTWRPISIDTRVIEGAWVIQDYYHLSWWDALIVSAAQVEGCRYLLTEDLQDHQDLSGVEVINPFRQFPDQLGL